MDPLTPPPVRHVTALDRDYPSRLRSLARPPEALSIRGGSLEAAHVVAIVGSRAAQTCSAEFAQGLARDLVRTGVVVVSGGAYGVDAAAHQGALDVGGRTWAVAGTGCEHVFPDGHANLFDRIAEGPGAMVWPFAPHRDRFNGSFVARNRVLVALADAVVVIQAGLPSGALNAAENARRQRRPLWVVPAAPWLGPAYAGSRWLLEQGAQALTSTDRLLRSLGLGASSTPPPAPPRPLSEDETAVVRATSTAARHLDEIAARAHLPAAAVQALLLTLALEDVVVEAPPGFFRCRSTM